LRSTARWCTAARYVSINRCSSSRLICHKNPLRGISTTDVP